MFAQVNGLIFAQVNGLIFAQVNGFNTFHHKTETLFKLTTMNTCLEPGNRQVGNVHPWES